MTWRWSIFPVQDCTQQPEYDVNTDHASRYRSHFGVDQFTRVKIPPLMPIDGTKDPCSRANSWSFATFSINSCLTSSHPFRLYTAYGHSSQMWTLFCTKDSIFVSPRINQRSSWMMPRRNTFLWSRVESFWGQNASFHQTMLVYQSPVRSIRSFPDSRIRESKRDKHSRRWQYYFRTCKKWKVLCSWKDTKEKSDRKSLTTVSVW